MNKALHLQWAEAIDNYRIVPRLFFTSYFVFWCWITVTLIEWYIHMPAAERSIEASGFGSVIFATATGFLKTIYDTYARTSRDWNEAPPTVTTSSSTTTIATGTP